ncbi:YcaO-like family protein [Paracoccus homiensis]|uniref:YcaO-like family protein n=1 Tax=Paracoccus homiensis TaxID=364199 RepID=A0A1I0DSG3_9RHOB|nr:YcaO-like family protein [Paracoccus homiensis]SET35148.1 YcaO-like family protein [Paracoccus homiensis]
MEPNALISTWRRYDWRESFFAPQMSILQALTDGNRTASGVGRCRADAFHRCLGETAEIHALQSGEVAFNPLRDGIAAHVDQNIARRAALMEAYERFAIMSWWDGHGAAAAPVQGAWLQRQGLEQQLADGRAGAALKRRTRFWCIDAGADHPVVTICRSTSPEGQEPILGFGCDPSPTASAGKALREMLLMEMNLMELLAARGSGQTALMGAVQRQIAAYARYSPALLPDAPEVEPVARTAVKAEKMFGAPVHLDDITPPDGPIRVWLCRPQIVPPCVTPERGSPFF